MEKSLFVSWGGSEAQQIALWLCEKVFASIPDIKPFVSPLIPLGADWRRKVNEQLKQADYCLGIVTDVSLNRPWFLFELANLHQRFDEIPMLRFCQEPSDKHPLSNFQMGDGSDFENVLGFAKNLLNGQNSVTANNALTLIRQREQEWAHLVGP